MYRVVVKVSFEAAHRLYKYDGKCHNLHGHSYIVYFTVESETLVATGFVIDFGDLKNIVRTWIDENWDHTTILWRDDPLLDDLIEHTKIFIMDNEPTAENMAKFLYEIFEMRISREACGAVLTEVSIMETVTSTATYRGE